MNIKDGINRIKDLFEEKSFEVEVERETSLLALCFLSEIEKAADEQGINRKELAERVGTSPSYITQIFRGNKTPNLKILTAMGLAVGRKFDVRAVISVEESRRDLSKLKSYVIPKQEPIIARDDGE